MDTIRSTIERVGAMVASVDASVDAARRAFAADPSERNRSELAGKEAALADIRARLAVVCGLARGPS